VAYVVPFQVRGLVSKPAHNRPSPTTTPSPTSKELLGSLDHNNYKDFFTDTLDLPFVNREQEVIDVSVTLIMDSINAARGTPDNQAFIMPFFPQMHGAGKTVLGKNLLEQAKKYKDKIKAVLTRKAGNLSSEEVSKQLDKFLGATYVPISINDLSNNVSDYPTFVDALYALIITSLSEAGVSPAREIIKQDRQTVRTLVSAIAGNRSIVLHFDEVGKLFESFEYNHPFFRATDHLPNWEMRRIYQLWNGIYRLTQMDGTYCFMSGKRSSLIFLGQGLLSKMDHAEQQAESPTCAQAIFLSMFNIGYIRELFDHEKVWEKLSITDEELQTAILVVVHRLTGGVPRLVSWTIKALKTGGVQLGGQIEQANIAGILKRFVGDFLYSLFKTSPSGVLSTNALADSVTREIYLRLLVLSLRGMLVDKDFRLSFGSNTVPLSLVVSALDCYVDKEVDSRWWKLVFPELVLMWVVENSPDQRLSFFASSILEDPDIVDVGSVNEKVFRLTFETIFTPDSLEPSKQKLLGKELSFFADTQLAEWDLRMQPHSYALLPKIYRSDKSAHPLTPEQRDWIETICALPREKWEKAIRDLTHPLADREIRAKLTSFLTTTANFKDSLFILQHMLPDGFLGCPVSEQSGMPDFVSVKRKPTDLTAFLFALWWQIKLLGESTGFSWAKVQKEVEKVPIIADHQVLVLAVSSLGAEIATLIGDKTHLLVPPGDFTHNDEVVLKIPDKLEVVILGEKGLAQLYSEYDLEGLKRLSTANTFEAISKRIQQPTGSLAGVALSPTPVPGKLTQYNHNYIFV
jgi:hypothetical protein